MRTDVSLKEVFKHKPKPLSDYKESTFGVVSVVSDDGFFWNDSSAEERFETYERNFTLKFAKEQLSYLAGMLQLKILQKEAPAILSVLHGRK